MESIAYQRQKYNLFRILQQVRRFFVYMDEISETERSIMRKLLAYTLLLPLLLATGCSNRGVASDYPAAVQAEGIVYHLTTGTLSEPPEESAIFAQTESFTNTYPRSDNQTNFHRELGLPMAKTETGIAVLYDGEWHLFTPANAPSASPEAPQTQPESVPVQAAPSPEPIPSEGVLTEPPVLLLLCGDVTIEALKGTCSWTYQNTDGTSTSIEADIVHPLDAKAHMPYLSPSADVRPNVLTAELQFAVAPQKVTARCWPESCWGQSADPGEPVEVISAEPEPLPGTAPATLRPSFFLQLKEGSYIYELSAQWPDTGLYGGTARYSVLITLPPPLPAFSYEGDAAQYTEDTPGVIHNDFVNFTPCAILNVNEAIARA